jgi:hypothetical protein
MSNAGEMADGMVSFRTQLKQLSGQASVAQTITSANPRREADDILVLVRSHKALKKVLFSERLA